MIQTLTLLLGNHNEKNAPNVESTLDIYYFDVGQGDSTLIKQDDDYMLIDAGNNEDGKKIVDYLKNNFYLPHENTLEKKSIQDVYNIAKEKNLQITNPTIGSSFQLGDAKCEIVFVDNNEPEEKNNSSIVLKMTFGNQTFLFSGDAEYDVESKLDVGKINIYKAGHHGSKSSSTADFIKRIDPDYAIISVGPNNDYNLPAPRVTNRLDEVCDKVYRTDLDGTIHLVSDGNTTKFECLKDICLDGNER